MNKATLIQVLMFASFAFIVVALLCAEKAHEKEHLRIRGLWCCLLATVLIGASLAAAFLW